MPELPEVETLKNALLPLIKNQVLEEMIFHRSDLRFPIPIGQLDQKMTGQRVLEVVRKGKYLLWEVADGAMVLHLGMSGRVVQRPSQQAEEKHCHAVFKFSPNIYLHFIDPRRFGCIVWAPRESGHPLLNHLGPDPLTADASPERMKRLAQNRKTSIKAFLMDAHQLAGVGNIYACESLFRSGIHPLRQAGRLSLQRWGKLMAELKMVLQESIKAGGSTLRDFYGADGSPGYYSTRFTVYGREHQPCMNCQEPISRLVQTGRSTFYCKHCQK